MTETQGLMYRFRGVRALYGLQEFEKFARAHITIVGVGGVGSWAVESLVRSGIGKITIIDNDIIDQSNTNRQLHTLKSTLGLFKVDVMKERMLDINDKLNIITIPNELTKENIAEFVDSGTNYIIDAIDSLEAKASLINYARQNGIPIVISGGVGGKLNPQNVKIKDLAEVSHDKLLSRLRSLLRKEYQYPKQGKKMNIQAVYCQEDAILSSNISAGLDVPLFGASMSVTATVGLNLAAIVLNNLRIFNE